MPFTNVKNLATDQASEDERRRQQQRLELARAVEDQKADAADGPAALLEQLTGGGRRAAVDGDVLANAEDDAFLNTQAQSRLKRRADNLALPGPSAAERVRSTLGPVADVAYEDPMHAAVELKTDPRGRMARLEATKAALVNHLTGDVSRETSPIFYAGNRNPTRGLAEGVTRETGDGPDTMAYDGALEGLRGAQVPRAGIRPEFGGTAPDETLAFSDRPEPGMRRYNARSGATKDVGAPGGGYAVVPAGGGSGAERDALLRDLGGEIDTARMQPLTPREVAGELGGKGPIYDLMASKDPHTIMARIDSDVAEGSLDPKVGTALKAKYKGILDDATSSDGEFDPQAFANFIGNQRTPAPGEAETRARTGGQLVPQVEAAKTAAVESARQAPAGAPGTTPAPPTNGDPGFFAGLAGAAQRGADWRTGGAPAPEAPPGLPAAMARTGIPLAGAVMSGGLGIPAAAAVGFGTGAGGELLGELLGDEEVDPRRIGAAGGGNALVGALAGPVGRTIGRGFRAVGALGKRMASDIPSIYTPGTAGAPTRVLGGLTEEAGVPGSKSALELARMGSADAGSAAIPNGPVPYLAENIPALRGGDFGMGAARVPDEVLSIEDLIAQYLQRSRRALPPGRQLALPAPDEATLPALRGGGFAMR